MTNLILMLCNYDNKRMYYYLHGYVAYLYSISYHIYYFVLQLCIKN